MKKCRKRPSQKIGPTASSRYILLSDDSNLYPVACTLSIAAAHLGLVRFLVNVKSVALRVLELALLGVAFALLIPPVPSDTNVTRYDFVSGQLAVAVVSFLCSQALALRRGAETWPFVVLKLIGFLIFARVVFFRSFIC